MKMNTPLTDQIVEKLHIGDKIMLSGVLYTARDAAHQRLFDEIGKARLEKRSPVLPFDLAGQIIYYVGPTPPKPGEVIGSAGPTTAYRMDVYTPLLLERGLKGTIAKGERSAEVISAMKKYKAVYFVAVGGAGALLRNHIIKADVIAYEDLGAEAVRKLEVKDFPLIVANDIYGNDLFKEGVQRYRSFPIPH
ncbi:MAG: Fe-S-containing hydro-lyase [Planctomycetota bacterium]|nr:Fe-S-containing hydro-lyase [Planctomycetota bacterium]